MIVGVGVGVGVDIDIDIDILSIHLSNYQIIKYILTHLLPAAPPPSVNTKKHNSIRFHLSSEVHPPPQKNTRYTPPPPKTPSQKTPRNKRKKEKRRGFRIPQSIYMSGE